MKRILLPALALLLLTACGPKLQQPELGARKAPVLTEGKYQFKDLNKNGRIDPCRWKTVSRTSSPR